MDELDRFIEAQEKEYLIALEEIKSGKKKTHWIWYIFPQLKELGFSSTSKYYGIKNFEEAKVYLENDLLRNRLMEITTELYKLSGDIFQKVLDKFYNGEKDSRTLDILKKKS